MLLVFALNISFAQEPNHLRLNPQAASTNLIEGAVSAINGTTIELSDSQFTIDASSAKIVSPGATTQPTLASITVGMHITAGVNLPTNGSTLQAITIAIPSPNRGRLRGSLQSIDMTANTLSILDHQFTLTAKTKAGKEIGGLANLKAGQEIVVTYEASNSGLTVLAITMPRMGKASANYLP
jgi:hypothetical protein